MSPPALHQVVGGDTLLSPPPPQQGWGQNLMPALLQASPRRVENGKMGGRTQEWYQNRPTSAGRRGREWCSTPPHPPTLNLCHLCMLLTGAQPCLVCWAVLPYILHKDGVHGLQAAPGGTCTRGTGCQRALSTAGWAAQVRAISISSHLAETGQKEGRKAGGRTCCWVSAPREGWQWTVR